MNERAEFEKKWPFDQEGNDWIDAGAYRRLQETQSIELKGHRLLILSPVCLGVAKLLGASWALSICIGAIPLLIEVIGMLFLILKNLHQLRLEVELVKGSIRANRWDARGRDRTLDLE